MRLAVFDLDGTLADTAPDLVGALNALLEAARLPAVDPHATRTIAGQGGRALIRHGWTAAGQTLSPDEIETRLPDFLDAYRARISLESRLFDGVEAALDRLEAEGWAFAICTNKPEALAVDLLDRLGVSARFRAVLGADTLPVRKPDPLHLIETIARSGGSSGRSVMIGDTRTDLETARNAAVPVALTRFGYAAEPIESLDADALFDHYDGLDAVLEALAPRDAA